MASRRTAAFDFDGTLTDRDSLLLIISHIFGRRRMMTAIIRRLPEIMLMKLGFLDNGIVKQRLFASLFSGMTAEAFKSNCKDFADSNRSILRPKAIERLRQHISVGDEVAIVSASPAEWIKPFFPDMPIKYITTKLEVKDGRLTGKFSSPNCNGAEKVKRLLEAYPDLTPDRLTAYGDSKGDNELLAYASLSHYKPFRN